jgi:hypothetical protein
MNCCLFWAAVVAMMISIWARHTLGWPHSQNVHFRQLRYSKHFHWYQAVKEHTLAPTVRIRTLWFRTVTTTGESAGCPKRREGTSITAIWR